MKKCMPVYYDGEINIKQCIILKDSVIIMDISKGMAIGEERMDTNNGLKLSYCIGPRFHMSVTTVALSCVLLWPSAAS